MGKPEAFVEKYLLDQCERHGLYCLKVVCESRNGFPDRFITGPNGPILVETKSPVGALRKEQKQFIEDLRERHVDVRTAYTRDQVDALLEELTGNPAGQRDGEILRRLLTGRGKRERRRAYRDIEIKGVISCSKEHYT